MKRKTIKKQQIELHIKNLPNIIIPTTASVCIIIPHRNRIEQLKTIINKMKSTNIDIYVIDQNNADKFNRGLLLNIGFHIASITKGKVYERYIFHDVDSYPDNELKEQYTIDTIAYPIIHYASPLLDYKYKYQNFFGGIVGFDKSTFKKINGFPNNIFGWGGEDDILKQRVTLKREIIYRPIIGKYELPEHDKPTNYEYSFQSNIDKWDKITKDKETSYKNGVNQIPNIFITIVQSENWRDFIKNYNISNINLNYTSLANVNTFPLIISSSTNKQNIYYYKIDYLAQHIITSTKSVSYLMNKNYVIDERKKRLSKFIGKPIFHNNDKNSSYYNVIQPLIYWNEIQEHIIDTYTEPKKAPKQTEITKINELLLNSFEKYNENNGNLKVSKLDLKNTIKHIFKTYNELLYFRIRNNKITHKYYIFNVGSPQIDWYQNLQWGKTDIHNINNEIDIVADKIKQLQEFMVNSKTQYYMTLAKPYFLRANGCLLGVESTDYIRELNTSYINEFVEMLEYSCNNYTMFDCDIIINRKDFAYLTKNNTYSYDNLLKNMIIKDIPNKWYPLLSQSVIPNKNLDIPIPTADEWLSLKNIPLIKNIPIWNKRYNTAFFRGKSTGCGTTIENNSRLKFSQISKKWEMLKTKQGLIDIGISNLTSRFKAFDEKALYIDKNLNAHLLGKKTNFIEQTKYKYIFNIPGNGQAYRFPTEFYKGAVILNVSNIETPQMWFEPLLKDGINYIRIYDVKVIENQETKLFETIKWLNSNDDKAYEIAMNGIKFAETYINKKTIAEYWCLLSYHLNKMIY